MNTKFYHGLIIGAVSALAAYKAYQYASKKIKEKKEKDLEEFTAYKETMLQGIDLEQDVQDLVKEEKFTPAMRVWFTQYLERYFVAPINYEPRNVNDKVYKHLRKDIERFDKIMSRLHDYDQETLEAYMNQKIREDEIRREANEKRLDRESNERKAEMLSDAIKDFGTDILCGQSAKNQYGLDMYKIFMDSYTSIATSKNDKE